MDDANNLGIYFSPFTVELNFCGITSRCKNWTVDVLNPSITSCENGTFHFGPPSSVVHTGEGRNLCMGGGRRGDLG